VVTPVLLPWIPGRGFWLKGAEAGAALGALLAVGAARLGVAGALGALGLILITAAVSSWGAMNYTGTSTYTSPSGVESEMRRGIPVQGALLGLGLLAWIVSAWTG
jgi:hypothetical protein